MPSASDSPRLNRFRSRAATRASADDPTGRSNRPRKVREACEIFVYTAAHGVPGALRPYIKSLIEFSAVAPARERD